MGLSPLSTRAWLVDRSSSLATAVIALVFSPTWTTAVDGSFVVQRTVAIPPGRGVTRAAVTLGGVTSAVGVVNDAGALSVLG